jgi:hypothetical protein
MASKKSNGFFDDLAERGEKRARRKAKSKIKKLHTATKVIAVLSLVVGLLIGAAVCLVMSKNDRFILKGDTQFSIDAGTAYTYREQGVEAICFGRDVSNTLKVTLSEGITTDASGNYVIPAEEGVYTITYTVDCLKFGENAPNGAIKRIRVFTVAASEEDGRGEEVAD